MAEKVYVGKGKTIGQFGNIKLSINVNDFQGNRVINPNEKGWINLILSKMKTPDKHGKEYTIYLDDFVPKQRQQSEDQDMPF